MEHLAAGHALHHLPQHEHRRAEPRMVQGERRQTHERRRVADEVQEGMEHREQVNRAPLVHGLPPEHAAGQDVSKEHRAEEQDEGGNENPALPKSKHPLNAVDRKSVV